MDWGHEASRSRLWPGLSHSFWLMSEMEPYWATLAGVYTQSSSLFSQAEGKKSRGSLDAPLPFPGHLVTTRVEGVPLVIPRGGTPQGKARPAGPGDRGDLPPDEYATSLNLSPSSSYPPTMQTYAIFIRIKVICWYRNQILMCRTSPSLYSDSSLLKLLTVCYVVQPQSCPTLCDPMNCSMPGFPVLCLRVCPSSCPFFAYSTLTCFLPSKGDPREVSEVPRTISGVCNRDGPGKFVLEEGH